MPLLGQLDLVTAQIRLALKLSLRLCGLYKGKRHTSINSLVLAINSITSNIEEVPNLIQRAAGAAEVDRRAVVQAGQGSLDFTQSVGLGATGGDASSSECLDK